MTTSLIQRYRPHISVWLALLLSMAGGACLWAVADEVQSFDFRLGLSPVGAPSAQPESVTDVRLVDETAIHEEFLRGVRRIRDRMERGDLDRARREVEIDLTVYGDAPILLHLAARIYSELGQLERAESYWARLAAAVPDDAEVLSAWGGALLHLNQYDKAEKVLYEALELDPFFPRTIYHLVCLSVLTDRFEDGMALLQGMAAFDLGVMARWMETESDALLRLLGDEQYVTVGRTVLGGGEEVLPNANLQRADHLPLSLMEADAGSLLSESEKAATVSADDMRKKMSQASEFIERYQALVRDERWSEAARVGSRPAVTRLGLTAPAFRSWIAYARFRNGEEGALEQLQSLTVSHPASLHPRLNLIAALRANGRTDLVDEEWRAVRKHYPRQPVAAELAYRMREIDQALARNDLEAAARLVREALSDYPDHDALMLLASRIAMRATEYEAAEQYLARLVAWDPDNAVLLNEWGGALLRLSRYDEAADALDRALVEEPHRMSVRFHRSLADAARGDLQAATGYLRMLHIVEYGQLLAWLAGEAEVWLRLMGEDMFLSYAGFALYGGYTPVAINDRSVYPGETGLDWAHYAGTQTQAPAEISRLFGEMSMAIREYLNAQGEGEGDVALQALSRADSLGARSPVLVVESVRLLLADNEDDVARSRMDALLDQYVEQADLLAEYGYLLLGRAHYAEAKEIFRNANSLSTDHPRIIYGLACALAQTDMLGEAFLLLERLEEVAPERLAEWQSVQHVYNEPLATQE